MAGGISHADHVAPSIRTSWQSLRRQAAVARSVQFARGLRPRIFFSENSQPVILVYCIASFWKPTFNYVCWMNWRVDGYSVIWRARGILLRNPIRISKRAEYASVPFLRKCLLELQETREDTELDLRHRLWDHFFCLNPLLFPSCANTFSKCCKITRGMKRSDH
jgi:hypothetical protein